MSTSERTLILKEYAIAYDLEQIPQHNFFRGAPLNLRGWGVVLKYFLK